jgi:tetratricopeptide (TPR) repeat protein
LPDPSVADRRILLAIVLIALVLRIAFVFDISDSPYFDYPTLDAFWYDAKAKDVLAGDLIASTGTFRVPLYIYFLAGVYSVFGHSFMAAFLIHAVLGAVTCGLLYILGKRLFGTLAGVVAGLGFAVYRMAIYYIGELVPASMLLLLLTGAVYLIVRAVTRKSLTDSLLAGFCLGLAFLSRPDIVPFAALLALAVAVLYRKERGVRIAVIFSTVLICFMLLQGFRNYAIFDKFFVFSPQGAVNLYIGNARYADGKTPVAPPTRHPYDIGTDPSQDSINLGCRQAAMEDVGRELSEQELSKYYYRKTFDEIRQDFPRWIGLMARKAYYVLNSYERSDIKLVPRVIERYSRVLRLPLLSFAVPVSLGLVGAAIAARRRRRLGLILAAGVLAYGANTLLFFVVWRYRLPAVPFLMVLAGLTVREFYRALRTRNTKLMLWIVVPVILIFLLSASRFLDVGKEDWSAQYVMNEAALYLKAGDYERAVEVYKEAIEMDPENARAYFYLGKAHATEGYIEESKEMMEKAISMNPTYRPYALLTLGVALANKAAYGPAAEYFGAALEADPELGLAAFNLGISLMNLGRVEDAERAFTRAEKLCTEDIGTLVTISQAYIRLGDTQRGLSLAQAVLARDPRNADALYSMGLGLEAEGMQAEALGYYERALGYRPGSPEIMQKIRSLRTGRYSR